jgi:cysteine desulfurase
MTDTMIYLDHAATTPLRPEARAAMEPWLGTRFGNAASSHAPGRAARAALEDARERVAGALGAERMEIVFTGSGTEADNLAVLGRWRHLQRRAGPATAGLVTSAVEHSAVREAAAQAAREGAEVTVLAVDEAGVVGLDALEEALELPQAVVSIMWGNNEVGTLQPVARAAALCRDRGVVFHTDAVQALGHVPVSVSEVACDLLALSAHKFGGPQGAGVLFVRRGVELEPLVRGGGQEGGLRSGTANVAGAVGLAAALERAVAEAEAEAVRLAALRDRLQEGLDRLDGVQGLGGGGPRLPHILTVGLDGVEADVLLASLDLAGLAVSSGAACQSGGSAPSAVMVAMGIRHDVAVRFSLGRTSTEAEVDGALARFSQVVERLRAAGAAGR